MGRFQIMSYLIQPIFFLVLGGREFILEGIQSKVGTVPIYLDL